MVLILQYLVTLYLSAETGVCICKENILERKCFLFIPSSSTISPDLLQREIVTMRSFAERTKNADGEIEHAQTRANNKKLPGFSGLHFKF